MERKGKFGKKKKTEANIMALILPFIDDKQYKELRKKKGLKHQKHFNP